MPVKKGRKPTSVLTGAARELRSKEEQDSLGHELRQDTGARHVSHVQLWLIGCLAHAVQPNAAAHPLVLQLTCPGQ